MSVIRPKHNRLGKDNFNSSIPLKDATVIPADSKRIATINKQLREKCRIQLENDIEVKI